MSNFSWITQEDKYIIVNVCNSECLVTVENVLISSALMILLQFYV